MASAQQQRPVISIVLPLYNEESVLPALHARLTRALAGEAPYELVFVNDGSSDRTLALLRDIVA
ncbi:MAG: glycosyltransferase, partial [Thermomicrobiales bacterium]